jgi:hypothetical protein
MIFTDMYSVSNQAEPCLVILCKQIQRTRLLTVKVAGREKKGVAGPISPVVSDYRFVG